MTDIIRTDAPAQSTMAVIAMAGLGLGMIVFAVLSTLAIFFAWPAYARIEWSSVWMGLVFILLAVFVDVYRRQFLPDELIHKKRRPKVVPKRDIR